MKTKTFEQIFDYGFGHYICNKISLLQKNFIFEDKIEKFYFKKDINLNEKNFYSCYYYKDINSKPHKHLDFNPITIELFKLNSQFSSETELAAVLFDRILEEDMTAQFSLILTLEKHIDIWCITSLFNTPVLRRTIEQKDFRFIDYEDSSI